MSRRVTDGLIADPVLNSPYEQPDRYFEAVFTVVQILSEDSTE